MKRSKHYQGQLKTYMEFINQISTEIATGEREQETISACCGAGHHDENMICEDCGEHCDIE